MKILLLALILLTSCGSTNSIKDSAYQRRDLNQSHITSGIEKYLLTSFPDWMNFSEVGECKRDFIPRYLEYSKLYSDHGLDYLKAMNLQALFNRNFLIKKAGDVDKVKLTEESYYFYTSFDEVRGGAVAFKPVEFSKVNIYWIDPAINNKAKLSKLISMTKKKEYLSAPPIFISSCLSEKGILNFLKMNVIDSEGARIVDATMFSVFNLKFKHAGKFSLNIGKLFSGKDINVYSTDAKVRDLLIGKYKLNKY
jgi:hypothetical protein